MYRLDPNWLESQPCANFAPLSCSEFLFLTINSDFFENVSIFAEVDSPNSLQLDLHMDGSAHITLLVREEIIREKDTLTFIVKLL